jgi:hypothetical protein
LVCCVRLKPDFRFERRRRRMPAGGRDGQKTVCVPSSASSGAQLIPHYSRSVAETGGALTHDGTIPPI